MLGVRAQINKSFIARYIEADYLIHANKDLEALKILLELYKTNMDNPNINFLIGACYMNLNQYEKAEPFLWRALPYSRPEYNQLFSDTIASMYTYFYLGIISQLKYRFNESIYYFNLFKYYLKSEYAFYPRYIEFANELDRWIETCHNARIHMASQRKIIIENIGPLVNTEWPEYAPVVSSDLKTLYFTTRRPDNVGGNKDVDDKYFEDICYATYNDVEERWENVKNVGTPINTKGHEATVSLSHDGQKLFIYRDDKGIGNVYVSTVVKNEWSKPERLNVNTKFWEPHACTSPDGKTLYFVSNRPGGFGGTDIYKSTLLPNGDWSEPVNLGPVVNSKYSEESPFMLSDGKTLYFSSKGHDSMGGYDVFTTTLDEQGNFQKPVNLGFPINTTQDDVFYFPTSDPNIIYFSSARKDGYGDMDIYRIKIIEEVQKIAILKGNVFDEIFFRPVSSSIVIKEIDGHFTKTLYTYQKTGEYYINLPIGKKYTITVVSTPVKVAATDSVAKHGYVVSLTTDSLGTKSNMIPDSLSAKDSLSPGFVKTTNDSVKINDTLVPLASLPDSLFVIEYDTIYDMLEILESDINQVITRMYLLKKPKPTLEEIEYIVEEVTVDSIPKPLYFEEISDVKLGDKIILKNIFYDFDKSTLRPESIKELENLLAFLNKRPTLRIEISGHTDNKGSARYNKKLSEDRAKSVVTYLVEHGIDPARLEAKGYGFDEPIATNDTDEGRQLNRRTEFMVIGL